MRHTIRNAALITLIVALILFISVAVVILEQGIAVQFGR